MNQTLHQLLIDSESLLHLSTTGAGPSLQKTLWETPGASAYLVGCFTPYAQTQLHSFLGHKPEQSYCSKEVAFDMAMSSYIRAAEHQTATGSKGYPLGIGVTASVASNRIPRGNQRAHLCLMTKDQVEYFPLILKKGQGQNLRVQHDETISRLVIERLVKILEPNHRPEQDEPSDFALERFYRYPIFRTDGTRLASSKTAAKLYFPATLNPIHDGHRMMCRAAEMHLSPGRRPEHFARYLVSSQTPHKGELKVQQMLEKVGMLRAERWTGNARIVEFSRDEPYFLDKARKRPGSTFIIGADTMMRILDPSWGIEIKAMMNEMVDLGVSFLVMGRTIGDRLVTCGDLATTSLHQELFTQLPGQTNLSSSVIRASNAVSRHT